MKTFHQLDLLLVRDPQAYRRAAEKLRDENPCAFDSLISHVKSELELSNQQEDRPLTPDEIEDLISEQAATLGWSRTRVLAEALLRLQLDQLSSTFKPLTPEEGVRRKGRYARRRSSAAAIAVGDVQTLLKKRNRRSNPP